MKFLSLVAVMVIIGCLPLCASEYVMEVAAKARMAKAAALTESGTTIGSKEAQKSITLTDDQQVGDAVAILNQLEGEHGCGLPDELCELIMEYDEQVQSKRLFNGGDSLFLLATGVKSNGEPVHIAATHRVRVLDKNGVYVRTFNNINSNIITNDTRPYSFKLTRNAENNLLATVSFGNGELRTWNVENGKKLSKYQLDKPCMSLEFDKHNTLLGLSEIRANADKRDKNRILQLWDVANNNCIQQFSVGKYSDCVLAKDNNNNMVAIVGKHDGFIEIWDVKTGTRKSVLRGHTDIGSRLTNNEIEKLDKGNKRSVVGLAVCKNKKNNHLLIASSGYDDSIGQDDKLVYIWDAQTGECLHLINEEFAVRVVGMDYNAQGDLVVHVAQGGYDAKARNYCTYVHALKIVSGTYQQAHKEVLDEQKARFIIQDAPEVVTHDGKELTWNGLPEALQRIVYEYAKPA